MVQSMAFAGGDLRAMVPSARNGLSLETNVKEGTARYGAWTITTMEHSPHFAGFPGRVTWETLVSP